MNDNPGVHRGLLWLVRSYCFVWALLLTACTAPEPERGLPPNIIIILSDDAGYADFGSYGSEQLQTPHIDSIAEAGVRFTSGYVSASVCSPSRAGLITGRYQQRFGHEFNLADHDLGLPVSEKTIADYLRDEGYRTGILGKWHLGRTEAYHPLNRGFDEFVGMLGGSRNYFPYTDEARAELRLMRQRELVVLPEPFEYFTDFLAEEAVRFIERHRSEPFFLYLSLNAVHTPLEALESDLAGWDEVEDERRKTLAAMTSSMDRAVGRLLSSLADSGLKENTLLFFLNDNGGATNNGSDNGPYRGMKGSKWEGGIRVPFLVQWPVRIPAGQVIDEPVMALDILPTCLAVASRNKKPKLDGVNLLPYLAGEKKGAPHSALFWRRGVAAAVRQGPWKAIRVKTNPALLFNIDQDPGETTNLAEEEPAVLENLLGQLKSWEEEMVPPLWRTDLKWTRNQILKHRMDVVTREQERKLP